MDKYVYFNLDKEQLRIILKQFPACYTLVPVQNDQESQESNNDSGSIFDYKDAIVDLNIFKQDDEILQKNYDLSQLSNEEVFNENLQSISNYSSHNSNYDSESFSIVNTKQITTRIKSNLAKIQKPLKTRKKSIDLCKKNYQYFYELELDQAEKHQYDQIFAKFQLVKQNQQCKHIFESFDSCEEQLLNGNILKMEDLFAKLDSTLVKHKKDGVQIHQLLKQIQDDQSPYQIVRYLSQSQKQLLLNKVDLLDSEQINKISQFFDNQIEIDLDQLSPIQQLEFCNILRASYHQLYEQNQDSNLLISINQIDHIINSIQTNNQKVSYKEYPLSKNCLNSSNKTQLVDIQEQKQIKNQTANPSYKNLQKKTGNNKTILKKYQTLHDLKLFNNMIQLNLENLNTHKKIDQNKHINYIHQKDLTIQQQDNDQISKDHENNQINHADNLLNQQLQQFKDQDCDQIEIDKKDVNKEQDKQQNEEINYKEIIQNNKQSPEYTKNEYINYNL